MPIFFLFCALWSHQLPWLDIDWYIFVHGKKKFNLLNFHVIDIKHLFQCFIYCYIILKSLFSSVTDVSVNANSFPVQCSVIASSALTKDWVIYFLPRKKMYSLNFHVIDTKHLFQCFVYYYIILKSVFLPNTWAGRQYQYLKHGDDNPVCAN